MYVCWGKVSRRRIEAGMAFFGGGCGCGICLYVPLHGSHMTFSSY